MCRRQVLFVVAVASLLSPRVSFAQAPPAQTAPPAGTPALKETVQVVATRIPESPRDVPASIEVFSGDDLRNLGASSLKDALALAAGVSIAPGGDAGPAGSVPEFWGLREFDAFLLVVDDVPWGGAFNPALTSLSLRDVERVEVLRGAAPVTFGATSFVGVIHVVHKPGTETRKYATMSLGNYRSGSAAFEIGLPVMAGWTSRVSADFERQGFADARTAFTRGHALYRGVKSGSDRKMWVFADLDVLQQDPSTPYPREGAGLSTRVPLNANYNPDNAFLNSTRFAAAYGFERPFMQDVRLAVTASLAHTGTDAFRGFLSTIADTANNATGLRQNTGVTDLYADAHLIFPERDHLRFIAGADWLHGNGDTKGAIFSYTVPLDATSATGVTKPTTLALGSEDRREFLGGYGIAEWKPTARVSVTTGLRVNLTFEEREEPGEVKVPGEDDGQTNFRFSGNVAAIYTAWTRGTTEVKVYGNYRNTFKPAAFDFGLGEAVEAGLLEPENARSFEGGVKSRLMDGRLDVEASVFHMDFSNLVTATVVNGVPALMNAGETRFQGLEIASSVHGPRSVSGRLTYSFHNAHFTDFVQAFDGVPTQLAGKRFEMSPRHLLTAAALLAPERGIVASLVVKYTGDRYLNKRNSALAPAFGTVDLGVGYRMGEYEFRFDGRNLGNRRDAVSESELGDAQYYRMTGREARLTLGLRF